MKIAYFILSLAVVLVLANCNKKEETAPTESTTEVIHSDAPAEEASDATEAVDTAETSGEEKAE